MDRYSLLGHVAPGMTSQLENLATEALSYILRRYGTAREAFVDLVSTFGYAAPGDLEFSTQVRMQHGSIPDLMGKTEDGEGVLLVEAKFWAPLTPNQPMRYLDRLPSGRNGMVLFVAPAGRHETLWRGLVARCQAEGVELRSESGERPNWRAARTSETSQLAFASWSFVLDHLENRLNAAADNLGAHEVWQLKGLCRGLEAPIELGEDPWRELRFLVEEASRHLVGLGIFHIKGYRGTPGPHSYRRYGTLVGRPNWFVGFSEQYAARFGESFLWVGGPSRDLAARASVPTADANPPRSYELGNEVLFPLDVPDQAAREVAVQALAGQIEDIARLLALRDGS